METLLPYLIGAAVLMVVQRVFPGAGKILAPILTPPAPTPTPTPTPTPATPSPLDELLRRLLSGQFQIVPVATPTAVNASEAVHRTTVPMEVEVRQRIASPG